MEEEGTEGKGREEKSALLVTELDVRDEQRREEKMSREEVM